MVPPCIVPRPSVLLQQEMHHINEARRFQPEQIAEWKTVHLKAEHLPFSLNFLPLFLFSESSPRPTIQDAGNRCFKTDLSGRGSPAPVHQRVVRPY